MVEGIAGLKGHYGDGQQGMKKAYSKSFRYILNLESLVSFRTYPKLGKLWKILLDR